MGPPTWVSVLAIERLCLWVCPIIIKATCAVRLSCQWTKMLCPIGRKVRCQHHRSPVLHLIQQLICQIPVFPWIPVTSRHCGDGSVNVSSTEECDDIGLLLWQMPQHMVSKLPAELKYSLIINHFKPDHSFKFPSRYLDGCNRSCQRKYLEENPWFVYSKVEDGLFCLPCVLFSTKGDLGQFVCEKFNTWSKKSRKFAAHNSNHFALTQAEALRCTQFRPS